MIFRGMAPRVLYSLLLSAGILSALIAVLAGSVCKSTPTFDFQASFAAPWQVLVRFRFLCAPFWLIVALVILPFSPKVLRRRSVVALIGVPILIYVLLGGSLAIELYWHPYTGCL